MRFLQCTSSSGVITPTDFSLIEFTPANIPSVYAILSHRWGPEEVTLQDVKGGNIAPGAGYKKLEFCAKQARRDGILYFWVDTCCINKESSAELSEAINSMFKWYQRATKCYVFLPDVTIGSHLTGTAATDWRVAFQNSTWFKRGWTLQELIAPPVVEFFSAEGSSIGDKKSLEQEIHQVTGVPVAALRGESLQQFDHEERMSWAARRETTIEEDAAYCQLGIFDVQMSLLYGEGRQKALARLQREIQISCDPTSLATSSALWVVPFERNPRFTGREAEIAQLERQLFASDHTSRLAVIGLGGIGKTQLVLELLYRLRAKHLHCTTMWIAATSQESLHQGYLTIARQLNISGSVGDNEDVEVLVQEHLSRVSHGRWVLVFDNADDIGMWTEALVSSHQSCAQTASRAAQKSHRLIDLLPQNRRGYIIFTTRDKKAAVKLAGPNIVTMSEMDEEMAMDLLKKSLAIPNLVGRRNDAVELLEELTYLPIAIVQGAAYINENGITLADYLALLQEKEEDVVELLSEDFEDNGRYREVKNPVATTWLISFEQIRQRDPLAAEYLSFMACVDPKDIPQCLLPPGPSRQREMEAVGTLTAYSFVRKHTTDSSLDLHRLVYLATRSWLRKDGTLGMCLQKTLVRLEQLFPNNDHQNRSMWRMYLPHVQQVLESEEIDGKDEYRTALMMRCGTCLSADGRWIDAEKLFDQVWRMNGETLAGSDCGLLPSTDWLALMYREQGRWQDAAQLQVQIMEARKAKLGASHPSTLASIYNLAITYSKQGRLIEAEELEIQVLETQKAKLGADHPNTLGSINNLATTYTRQGRFYEAEQLQVQVLEVWKAKSGANHPDMLASMNNLALTYKNQGRFYEAEQLQVQVLEVRKVKLGADHPDTLDDMTNLAITWKALCQDAKARQLMKLCVDRRTQVLGGNHPDALSSSALLREWEAELEDENGDENKDEDS